MRRVLIAALALLAAACADRSVRATGPVQMGPWVTVVAEPVAADPTRPDRTEFGRFRYAGGLALTASDSNRLHGLSDIRALPDNRILGVTDEGDLFEARLRLDASGRLAGVDRARITPLQAPEGGPLGGKLEADAEGLALLKDGSRLVSFEQRHRILLYPADGRPPRQVNSPEAAFPPNGGLEALSADPARGPDAWLAGGEESGELWTCALRKPCQSLGTLPKPFEFGLVAVTPLPGGGLAYMIRAWDPLRGSRIALILRNAAGVEVDRLELARPLTTDNFEGVDVLPGKDGGLRFLLASDDNFSTEQRTLLLAFDWKP
ncbi:esterase-like activity of phytase family protein [Phenylobacterium parvum]|uniref:Phytase-like domain-containing protein n=1 Tax=Phenylobacterium parvum TaxID=2201350 RepID=A0A2Z3I014_9CAUL|nr:esterase-like activity of phytase family protein [Phenylobacterium parvum]AWM76794.1 hypothetical protein HYN04_02875 [Phenylobacterium parvum]